MLSDYLEDPHNNYIQALLLVGDFAGSGCARVPLGVSLRSGREDFGGLPSALDWSYAVKACTLCYGV